MKEGMYMKMTCEEMMEIIEVERDEEQLCVDKLKWMMKRTLNPIRKINCYFDAKRFMAHVAGMDLIIHKLQRVMRES